MALHGACQEGLACVPSRRGRRKQGEQGRQHREVDGQRDEHPRAGDQTQFRQPTIVRGQEGVESGRCRHSTQAKGAAYAAAGATQGRRDVHAAGQLLAAAQAHMDAEVDSEADEQDREGHRDQVELADGERREGSGPNEAHQQRRDDNGDEARRAEPGDEQGRDQHERDPARRPAAQLDAFQLLLVEGDGAGQPQAEPVRGVDAQLRGDPADMGDRGRRRLERAVVEHRLHQHEARRRAFLCALQQRLPGEGARSAQTLGLHHGGDAPERHREVVLGAALLERHVQHLRQAAQARVLCQGGEQRLGRGQAVGQLRQLLDVQIEKSAPPEKEFTAGQVDTAEQRLLVAQPVRQLLRRRLYALGGRSVDHRHDEVVELWEGAIERQIIAAKGHIGRDHVGGTGVDHQSVERVDEGNGRQRQGDKHDHGRSPPHNVHPAGEGAPIQAARGHTHG